MCEVAYCYRHGEGVAQNDALAFEWYLKAAESGDAKAQYEISRIFEHGLGDVPRDLQKAHEWCRKAAEQDFKSAEDRLPDLAKLLRKENSCYTT
jgi:TPR repeat protein